ncbi:PKD domain-containing protein [Aliikangiella sp. G2MR2-5]|uniref:PKD domain-containing protein n=1 Tax=Aliikangiella sp. G2MR2-5 TaxID=2788943 RepID=UPI0018A99D34|nr:PKD domain-containing protein [Aliikangiella sp. G2MR2-5]
MKKLVLSFTAIFVVMFFNLGCGGGKSDSDNGEQQKLTIDSVTASQTEIDAGESLELAVIANGGNHDGLTFSWTSHDCDGKFSQSTHSVTTFAVSSSAVTHSCTIHITVSNTNRTVNENVVLNVVALSSNQAPEIISDYQSATTADSGIEIVFKVTVSDESASTLSFEWQTNAGSLSSSTETVQQGESTSEISFTPPSCNFESITVSVRVRDESDATVEHQFTPVNIPVCATTEINPVITITRVSGETPFHVFVSASESTANNVDYPFDEIEYQWDFGASEKALSFTHPVTNESVNANRSQTGPEAAFVYYSPGTYTITLTAALGEEIAQTSIEVIVDEWTGATRYFDPVNGDDNNDGLSDSAPMQSWQALVNWLSGGNHRQALIKKGTIVNVDSELYLTTSRIRLGSYGEGQIPQLLATGNINYFVRLSPANELSDVVISDLQLNGNNGNATNLIYATLLNEAETLRNVAILNLHLVNDDPHELDNSGGEIIKAKNHIAMQNVPGTISDVLVWNTTFERNHGFKNGIYAEIKDHLAIVGCRFSGGDGNSIKDHPIYPAGVYHALYRWNDFQSTYSNNFSINSAAKDGLTVRYTLFDGNDFSGGQNGIDLTKHTDRTTGWFSDVIVQNNAFHNLGSPAQGYGIIGGSLERIAIRDNVFYGNPQSDIYIRKDGDREVSLALYRNKFWKGSEPVDTLPMLDFGNIRAFTSFENIFVNEGVTGGSTNILSFIIPENSDWVIDHNQYWSPEIPTPFNLPGQASYSFEQWQQSLGFDSNGKNENPLFVDPANGEF